MRFLTHVALADMLANHKGATFATVVTATEPKMNKRHRETGTPNPFRRVQRHAMRHVMLGASYENAVNARRVAENLEPDFKAESLWNGKGEAVANSRMLVKHKNTGKMYMVFYPYRDDSVVEEAWLADGRKVAAQELEPYLPPVSSGSSRQGTERAVSWRVVALENIVMLKMNGETYMVAN